MAIAKMLKQTIIFQESYREELLAQVQALQAFEPVDMSTFSSQTLATDERVSIARQDLDDAEMALAYLQPLLKKEPLMKQLKKIRRQLTFQELEAQVAQWQVADIVAAVLANKKQRQGISDQLKQLAQQETELRLWEKLPLTFKMRKQLKHVYATIGTIPQQLMPKLATEEGIAVTELFTTADEAGVLVLADRRDKDVLKNRLQHYHFSVYRYMGDDLPPVALDRCLAEQARLREEEQRLLAEAQQMHDTAAKLELIIEVAHNRLTRTAAQSLLYSGVRLTALSGWITADDSADLAHVFQTRFPSGSFAILTDEVSTDDIENMPTVLKNHPLVEPFELLTEMYGVPKNGDIDPTPLFTPFYMMYFGMMVADIAYGLLMGIGTWLALKYMGAPAGLKKGLRLFHILSYPTVLWGIVYGSFAGISLPFRLLSTEGDVITVLGISVLFGVIQLLFGIGLNAYLQVKQKAYQAAYTGGFAWLGIFIGIIILAAGSVLNMPLLQTVGQWLSIANAIGIVLVTVVGSKNKFAGLASGLYNLYGISSYVGDLVSFTRLMALSVSGASIASAFNLIVGFLPPAARFTVGVLLFLVLQGLNMFLSVLGGYVHGARLQFVEFFNKFYEGGGRSLQPLKTYEKYIDLEKEK